MGTPVQWDYALVIQPGEGATNVQLWRMQRGHQTRFLWQEMAMKNQLGNATVQNVLQELYTGLMTLIEENV